MVAGDGGRGEKREQGAVVTEVRERVGEKQRKRKIEALANFVLRAADVVGSDVGHD